MCNLVKYDSCSPYWAVKTWCSCVTLFYIFRTCLGCKLRLVHTYIHMYIHRCQKPGTDRPERQFNKGRIRRRVGERTMRCWTRRGRTRRREWGECKILRDRPCQTSDSPSLASPSSDSSPPGFSFFFLFFVLSFFSFLFTCFHERLFPESLKGALCVFLYTSLYIFCWKGSM